MITENEIDIGFAAIRKVLSYSGVTEEPVLIHTMNVFGEGATGEVVEATRLIFAIDGFMYLTDLYETNGETYSEVHRYAIQGSWRVFPRDKYEEPVPEKVDGEVVSSSVEEEGDQNEED